MPTIDAGPAGTDRASAYYLFPGDGEAGGGGGDGLATFLGLFSLGLGLAEAVAPGRLGRLIGLENKSATLQAFGVRELASGVGILASDRPAGWLWARVAGDVMDLAVLGAAYADAGADRRGRLAAAAAAVAGVTVLDVIAAGQHDRAAG